LAHHQTESKLSTWQGAPWRLSPRSCLLEGCERNFRPNHPLTRYCCDDCQAAAARWYRSEANRRYRVSENGKERRREQAKRYRLRVKDRHETEEISVNSASDNGIASEGDNDCEGYAIENSQEKFRCQRPGCYRRFTPPARSPLKKFCCANCRKALRRVLIRERRWFRRLGISPSKARDGPLAG
jgi:hypothetical protein